MKCLERIKEKKINHGLHGLVSLTFAIWGMVFSASAAVGTSAEFRVDLAGMGPWEMRTARASEAISYSTAWATNLTAAQQASANVVVKVWPVKREKPKYIAIDLSGGTTATHYPIEYLDEIPGGRWSDEYKTSKLVLRHIPAGSFIMGGRATDYPGAVNTNLHMVTLTKDFYMGVFEVTQRQWELVMGSRPSWFTNEACYATRPVEEVSYANVRGNTCGTNWPSLMSVDDDSFLGIFREKSKFVFADLPTEAQWEYACRAGTDTALNNGQDIASGTPNGYFDNVGRVGYNGLRNPAVDDRTAVAYRNLSTSFGTTAVGTYPANLWGLYDMHGNVYEWCLDRWNAIEPGTVDPTGDANMTNERIVIRSGCWVSTTSYSYVSGYHQEYAHTSMSQKLNTLGFRLCLQGGEIPDMTEGTELVNAAGEGTANWMPTKAGTYYLTHETQTNGMNGAELLGAWFKVEGPELTFTPDGDLTPGVKIAIGGAGEGWTVRYEVSSGGQGAARPTSESPEYTGPITLNDSQTIRAIAFSDGGLASREFSATYSLMSIGSAVAKPRYPWNGKVDIDCEVKGDANRQYLIALEAIDLAGNTNLPVRTVVGRAVPSEPQSPANEFDFGGAAGIRALPPGTYRFTWEADADIAGDLDFANVAVKISAEGSAIIAAKKVLPLEVAGYTGTETLTNVPVLVRLSTAIAGFDYADFTDANGGDLIFTDESGSVVYPHEIDEWHVGGESLVWVRLPTMANGTRFKMAYGNSQLTTHNSQLSSHEVWRDYAGVWHMNEDSGTAFDSTAHGLDALPCKGTNTLSDASQMVAYENGACGRARVNGTASIKCGNFLMVPAYDAIGLGTDFVVVGWFRANNGNGWQNFFVRNDHRNLPVSESGWHGGGWGAQLTNGSTANIYVVGGSNTAMLQTDVPNIKGNWVQFVFVYCGDVVSCFTNGAFLAQATIVPVSDNGSPLGIGGWPNGREGWSLNGQYDEIRLRGGSLSADRIKADYDMIKNRNFLTYGPVESGRGAQE